MVFYYTATGNSLFAAKHFSSEPVSIPQELKKERLEYTDRQIGIVCPIFSGDLPKTVWEFIKQASFTTNYFYMILTYGMSASDAAVHISEKCRRIGIKIDYICTVKTVDNYLPGFDMEQQITMDKHEEEQLSMAAQAVRSEKHEISPPEKGGRALKIAVALQNKMFPSLNNGSRLVVTDSCTGCGICSKVCPTGNLYVESGKAKRRRKACDFCLACAPNCPQKVITIEKGDKNPKARYRNPHISLEDIINSNNQN